MELALFLWVVFATLNVGLMYYMACVIASKRSGLQIPQILIDPDGIAEVGLFHFEFSAWTDLSDMAVATKEDDTGTTYGLVAFAKGEPVPDQHEDRIRLAKLKLSLPGLREISSDTIEIYSDLCRYLNAWRRHVLEGGPIPNRWRLQGVDELVEVTALSRAELDASWRAIRARY